MKPSIALITLILAAASAVASEQDAAVAAARQALGRAEQQVLSAPVEEVLRWLKAAEPAATADEQAKRRIQVISHLVDVRLAHARGDGGGAAQSLAAAANLARDALKADDAARLKALLPVLRECAAVRLAGPQGFLALCDLGMEVRPRDFAAVEADLTQAVRRSETERHWDQAARRLDRLARELRREQDDAAVAAVAERVAQQVPAHPHASRVFATITQILLRSNNRNAAEQVARRALSVTGPTTPTLEALYDVAEAYWSAGCADAAKQVLAVAEAAVPAAKADVPLCLRRAAALRTFGLLAQAEKVCRACLAGAATDRRVALALIELLIQQGRLDEASSLTPSLGLQAGDLLKAARFIERLGFPKHAGPVLDAISRETLVKDSRLTESVKQLRRRVLASQLASAKAEADRSTRLAQAFALRSGRAKAAGQGAVQADLVARSAEYRKRAGQAQKEIRKIEAQIKVLEQ